MRKINLLVSCIILLSLNYNCSKEEVKPITFREAIIGKWELRAGKDRIRFGDEEFHNFTAPYLSLNFMEDSTYLLLDNCTDIVQEGTFQISEIDTIIKIFIPFLNTLQPEEFNNESFIISQMTDEGVTKQKYYKVN